MPFSNMDGPGDYHSKWSQAEKDSIIWYHLYVESSKNYPDELIYRTETDSEKELMSPGGRDRLRVWDWHVHTAIFKVDNQQGPTVHHKDLCSICCIT